MNGCIMSDIDGAAFVKILKAKPHTVPEETETDPQFGDRRPGLGTEVPAEGRDWGGTGDSSPRPKARTETGRLGIGQN